MRLRGRDPQPAAPATSVHMRKYGGTPRLLVQASPPRRDASRSTNQLSAPARSTDINEPPAQTDTPGAGTRGRPGNGADCVPKLALSSTRENRRRASPELLEAVLQADQSGCQVNRHRPIWLLHARRPSEFTDRSGCRCIRTDPRRRMRPDSYSKPAPEGYLGFYSSSIWLYITRTVRMADDSAFRIGVLHLVARRAASERLYGDSERARKRGANSGFRSGLDAAVSRVRTSIDLNEPHCGPSPPDLRLVRIRGGRTLRRDEYRARCGCLGSS